MVFLLVAFMATRSFGEVRFPSKGSTDLPIEITTAKPIALSSDRSHRNSGNGLSRKVGFRGAGVKSFWAGHELPNYGKARQCVPAKAMKAYDRWGYRSTHAEAPAALSPWIKPCASTE